MKKTIVIGYVGKRRASITVTLEGERLSIIGEIWNGRAGGEYEGGQCLDAFRDYAKRGKIDYRDGWDHKKLTRLLEVWDRWHLNDMRAGCEHQRALGWDREGYDAHPIEQCPTCGYKYGSAWLTEKLPEEIIQYVNAL